MSSFWEDIRLVGLEMAKQEREKREREAEISRRRKM